MNILGIESSCDETAASIVRDGWDVKSNVIATQHDLHERYAGVVPEIASRAHLERIMPVVREALDHARLDFNDLDAIAVGHRPGLIGSLLVGVAAAKTLAWRLNIPILGVDHILAHLHACRLNEQPIAFPALGLVVSGGHTSLFLVRSPLDMIPLGRTIDDAIGEAFDKAASILELGYPGGPRIDSLARHGNDRAHTFPVANLGKLEDGRPNLDFSYSGLKTSLLYNVRGRPSGRGKNVTFQRDAKALSQSEKADFAASFQRAAVRAVTRNIERCLEHMDDIQSILVGGGVSANSRLRADLTALAADSGLELRLPAMEYCMDNAAMIAGLAAERLRNDDVDGLNLEAAPRSLLV